MILNTDYLENIFRGIVPGPVIVTKSSERDGYRICIVHPFPVLPSYFYINTIELHRPKSDLVYELGIRVKFNSIFKKDVEAFKAPLLKIIYGYRE
jgi:hypothetical protein